MNIFSYQNFIFLTSWHWGNQNFERPFRCSDCSVINIRLSVAPNNKKREQIKKLLIIFIQMGAAGTDDNVAIEICSDVDLTSCCRWPAFTLLSNSTAKQSCQSDKKRNRHLFEIWRKLSLVRTGVLHSVLSDDWSSGDKVKQKRLFGKNWKQSFGHFLLGDYDT